MLLPCSHFLTATEYYDLDISIWLFSTEIKARTSSCDEIYFRWVNKLGTISKIDKQLEPILVYDEYMK